jgi:hypothetical protein
MTPQKSARLNEASHDGTNETNVQRQESIEQGDEGIEDRWI